MNQPSTKRSRAFHHRGNFFSALLKILLFSTLSFSTLVHADVKANGIQMQSPPVDELIVKFRSPDRRQPLPIAAANQLITLLNQQLQTNISLKRAMGSGARLMTFDAGRSGMSVQDLANRLASRSDIEYAVPNRRLYTLATPNDARYNEQWHYYEPTGGINLPAAWDTNEGHGVVVAVIDTG
ncbi:MAG: hypothetical protein ABR612_13655, partial [Chromatocurvus sp.]